MACSPPRRAASSRVPSSSSSATRRRLAYPYPYPYPYPYSYRYPYPTPTSAPTLNPNPNRSKRELFAERALELAAVLGWVKARATAAADLALKMGPAHPAQLCFEYDETTAPTLGAEARRLL